LLRRFWATAPYNESALIYSAWDNGPPPSPRQTSQYGIASPYVAGLFLQKKDAMSTAGRQVLVGGRWAWRV
jgi:hypothetical protein